MQQEEGKKNKLCNGKGNGIPVYLSRLGFMQLYSGPLCLYNMYVVKSLRTKKVKIYIKFLQY